MDKIFLIVMIIGFPVSVIGSLLKWPAILMFIIYCLTIVTLAFFMSKATENVSMIAGERIGGLLNATFGNAVELMIAIFSLHAGLIQLVLASISGSVIGNLLFNGGLAFFIGGIKHKRLQFNAYNARHNSVLLIFAVIVAFLFPKFFSYELHSKDVLTLTVSSSVILILLYLAGLYFKLVTHRGVYQTSDEKKAEKETKEQPEWGLWRSLITLIVLTLAAAYISENLVDTFKTVSRTFGWSEIFIGIIIVSIVGNASEYVTAIMMAVKNRVSTTVEIAIGSTLQISMFVAPILVLVSLLFPEQMKLIFTVPEMIAMVLAVLLNVMIMNDGDANWFEGATLVAAYVIMGTGFYLL
ncbi:calcium/proton exchanger [Scopulibacillus cellulosilyticus]|uniref:Ca(2+)/H(+) antiporter n=1 Tax=Scopulibacillus cellulosilyticus TaxID=2665665 RepID=A0ABW2PVA8_9BACL